MDTTRPSLLLRIRDRSDTDAWRAFDAIYRPMLRRFARARGLCEEDAEDVTQHCLTALVKHVREFAYDPSRGRFKSWLRTLVNNRVRDLFRARRSGVPRTGELERQQETKQRSPEQVFDQIWLEEHLWHCLRELHDEVEESTYQAFVRYVIDQRSIEEVCEELHLQPNNVYTIKWRLTQRLQTKMGELLDDGE